ncbi:hypothetical protein ACHAWF_016040 [Thalassiosira exigua]
MGKASRRRSNLARAAAAAVLLSPSVAGAAARASTAALGSSSTGGASSGRASPLTTAFSCGSRWRDARTCGTLCPSGRDDACPSGQRCYGGIACDSGMGEVLERQRRLEREEEDRSRRVRDGGAFEERFVCGASYEDAEARCASPDSVDEGSATAIEGAFCPTGSSEECPTGSRCYAAVSCPRHAVEEELVEETGPLWNHSLVTEPMLLNSTATMVDSVMLPNSTPTADCDGGGWGSSLPRESLPRASSLLSSGPN